ncbi:MAG: adenylylsulfate kinase [Fibrobacteres bacterium]|nr:adenylylsulfate kinase [Fibrobacterota bacterium]
MEQTRIATPFAPTGIPGSKVEGRIRMNIVIVGHVDHGKSTVVGRLLADTGSLPDGKLDSVRAFCERNSRPFEYAFLLDALKDEQAQGITIDTARTFFKSGKRDYIIIDAPGHIEFLKNMVTGAARAEAAVLVIDAKEGIRENSKRHGYLLSMLGIKQIAVVVNKMDLVGYSKEAFEDIRDEYIAFLARIGATPKFFIPISAFNGENLIAPSDKMPWYKGHNLLSAMDAFEKEPPKANQPFRMPIQDIYKFTSLGDDRRIVSGRVESGSAQVGDPVVFLPSGKKSRIASIEGFHALPRTEVGAGVSIGFTLAEQIYVGRGELMVKASEVQAEVSRRLRINLFWMGKKPFTPGKTYYLKLGTAKVPCRLEKINFLVDASESGDQTKSAVERHDVADCIIELSKPLAFDPIARLESTGRFVIVDQYEIAGGGIVREALAEEAVSQQGARPSPLTRSSVAPAVRAKLLGQKAALILFSGGPGRNPSTAAKALEGKLVGLGRHAFYIGLEDKDGQEAGGNHSTESGNAKVESGWDAEVPAAKLGEAASLLLDAGYLVVAAAKGLDSEDIKTLENLVKPHTVLQLEAPADAEEATGTTAGIVEEAIAKLRGSGSI